MPDQPTTPRDKWRALGYTDAQAEAMEAIAQTGLTAEQFAAAVSANAKAAPSWLDLTDDTPTSQRE